MENSSLRDSLKQSKPFPSAQAETFVNVLRTSAALVDDLSELLRLFDLTQPQYNVLRILRGAGKPGLPRGEVGARMISRDPDVTRLLDRMEARGLLTRSRQDDDRRVVRVCVTEEGLRLVAALDEPLQKMHVLQLGDFSESELATFNTLLLKVMKNRRDSNIRPKPDE